MVIFLQSDTDRLMHNIKMRGREYEKMIDWDNLKPMLNELEEASINAEYGKIRKLLKQIVPQFEPQSNILDI